MSSITHAGQAAPRPSQGATIAPQSFDEANAAIRAIVAPPHGGCPACVIEAGQQWPENNPNSRICPRHAAAMVTRSNALKSRVMGVPHA